MTRPTASTITDDQLDALYVRLARRELYMRAVNRADALADEWADDPTPISRAEAAELLSRVLELTGWEQTDAPPPPHLALVGADSTPTPEGSE